jgi:hypothetical protein
MKKSQILLFSILGIAFTTMLMSCSKNTDDDASLTTLTETPKGSISLTVGSDSYTKLFSSVTYSISDTMVSFWAINLDTEDSFIVSFGTVPEVGQTKQVNITTDDGMLFLINGAFQNGGYYHGESGTVKRVSTDVYEINVDLNNSQDPVINMAGTITVGISK